MLAGTRRCMLKGILGACRGVSCALASATKMHRLAIPSAVRGLQVLDAEARDKFRCDLMGNGNLSRNFRIQNGENERLARRCTVTFPVVEVKPADIGRLRGATNKWVMKNMGKAVKVWGEGEGGAKSDGSRRWRRPTRTRR